MAISQKVKEWFQEEYGYPIEDAFEMMQLSPDRLDAENTQMAETLARKTGYERHPNNPTP